MPEEPDGPDLPPQPVPARPVPFQPVPAPASPPAGPARLLLSHASPGVPSRSRPASHPAVSRHLPPGRRSPQARRTTRCRPGSPAATMIPCARGFAAGGPLDQMEPGPALAGVTADAAAGGLAVLDDDQLVGVLCAARRLESWASSIELRAVADLTARRDAAAAATGDRRQADHVGDEVAAALTLTGRAADRLVSLAIGVTRLPAAAAALAAGRIDLPRAAVFADELAGLGDVAAAAIAAVVGGDAAGLTTSRLRDRLHREVLAFDPQAARKRREKAEKDARVECWAEPSGTWSMAGRDLPPAGVLAADQHLDADARALKAAGAAGTLPQLRAAVFLARLNGQPLDTLLPAPHPGRPGQDLSAGQDGNPAGEHSGASHDGPGAPGAGGDPSDGDSPGDGSGLDDGNGPVAATVRVTVTAPDRRRSARGPGPGTGLAVSGRAGIRGRADRDDQPDRSAGHLARPVRAARRGRRIRAPGRRRLPRPRRHPRGRPRRPLAPDHHPPRRHRHRPRHRKKRKPATEQPRHHPADRTHPAAPRHPAPPRRPANRTAPHHQATRHQHHPADRAVRRPGTARRDRRHPAHRAAPTVDRQRRAAPLARRASRSAGWRPGRAGTPGKHSRTSHQPPCGT